MTTGVATVDMLDVDRAVLAPEILAAFNAAGVLAPADVHAAVTLGRLAGDSTPDVLLAAALAVRAPRLQHVCVNLAEVRRTATARDDEAAGLEALPWPSAAAWRDVVAASPLVAAGPGAGDRPLRLAGDRLYLDRYWRYEQRVIAALTVRARAAAPGVDHRLLRAGLDRIFGPPGSEPDLQRLAAAAAVLGRLAVVAGGPGTGKTTTITRILALLAEQALAAGAPPPRVALAAPTGKAAQRMEDALAAAREQLPADPALTDWLLALEGATLHRLLRTRPGSSTRFRHGPGNPLPHDVVVVDETSMTSLSLMAKLLEAVRDDARLILVGDPEQLASVEAGSVLGDVVGPANASLCMSVAAREELAGVTGEALDGAVSPGAHDGHVADRIVVLRRVHRFRADSGIADLAVAVQDGDGDAAVAVLGSRDDVRWIPVRTEDHEAVAAALAPVRERVADVGDALLVAARRGDGPAATAALERFRLLCAHRRGPFGVASWIPLVERWLAADVDGFDAGEVWYVGRPVLVTRNDYQLGLMNGDVGVTIADPGGGVVAAFPKAGGFARVRPARLEHVESVHAMTVHKAQGSQFAEVAVVLPPPDSPILTRELFYTAITRAQRFLTVIGEEDAVRAAVGRRIQRASGLRDALWGGDGR